MRAPTVVAEIGCNHKGDMTVAKEMIAIAASFCKADVVKFQKRNPRELLSPEQYHAPHPNPVNAYGPTYGEHREYLEFDVDQHRQLIDWCAEFNIKYSTSVWDMTSAREIAPLEPEFIKIPSATNLNFTLLGYLCDHFGGDLHISLGMTSKAEQERIVDFVESRGRARDTVLYACTSGYPVDFQDICLYEILRLEQVFGTRVKEIGFSGHHLGIAVDVAAVTLGATCIERHYTLDRTWKGTDHAASLEPDGLRKLVRDLHNVAQSLGLKASDILGVEEVQRDKLKWIEPSEVASAA